MFARPSSFVLVVANLLPLVGVLWFGWSVLSVLLLYWAESLIVGTVNVLRLGNCRARGTLGNLVAMPPMHRTASLRYQHLPGLPDGAAKFFLVPFFIVHYGAFCFAHLLVIVSLFSPQGLHQKLGLALPETWQPTLWLPLVLFAASHLYSYVQDFLASGEYRRVNVMGLMHRPYRRILAMHIAIIAGAVVIHLLGSPLPLLVVLVAAKTLVDLHGHERERNLFRARSLAA